jgi:membrane protease subunit (stomatin/prohibitin family)
MNMKDPTTEETLRKMAEAKNSMEKSEDFVSDAMRAARAKTSLDSFGAMRLSRAISGLKASRGEARKSAAAGLAKSLLVTDKPASKAAFCKECGTKLNPGAVFCPGCGTKTGVPVKARAARLPEFHF